MYNHHRIRVGIAVVAGLLLGQEMVAETVTLRSGKTISGHVILQNDEVIILKDATGARFQFPMEDVEKVEQTTDEETVATPVEEEEETVSKVALRINLMGGGSAIPDGASQQTIMGGNVNAEIQIGSRDLMGKRIFVGGSIGYMGVFAKETYSLIPLKAVVSVPLLDGKHAPGLGMNLGYAFGTGPIKGGMTGGVDVSWRYQITKKLVFLLGCQAGGTQIKMPVEEIVDAQTYINNVGRAIVNFGIKTAIQF